MNYDFDHVPDRLNSDCEKWTHFHPDVLPLWVADMDFPSPEPVIRALQERISHGVFGYPQGVSIQSKWGCNLIEVILERLKALYDWEIQAEDLVFLPGVVVAFNLACHTMASPGGGVLVQTPVYPPFLSAPLKADQSLQSTPLLYQPDSSYSLDLDAFEAAITPETNLFILCNPHNPVGRVFRQEELTGMAEACLRHDVVICSDEIHCDFIYPGNRHIPIASLDPEIARNSITLMAPSKTFNIAGLQSSFAIIPNPSLRRSYIHSTKGLVSYANMIGLTAAVAAYQEGGEWLEQLLVYLQKNRDFLYQYVSQEMPGIKMSLPEGTFLAWLDCRDVIQGNPQEFFLQQARVALNDGATFGEGGEGFVRINFGCTKNTLRTALRRMRDALGFHTSGH